MAPDRPPPGRPIVLAMSGASGAPYSVRLLQLLSQTRHQVHLIISHAAKQVLYEEIGIDLDLDHLNVDDLIDQINEASSRPVPHDRPASEWLHYHKLTDWSAGIASGSYLTAGMIVCPCSMSTVAAIANGLSTNLIHRAADVHLKERRKLVLVPRETPLNLIHLENLTQCTRAGATILPAMPGWYNKPQSLDDIIDFIVGRIVDQFGLEVDLIPRWGGCEENDLRSSEPT